MRGTDQLAIMRTACISKFTSITMRFAEQITGRNLRIMSMCFVITFPLHRQWVKCPFRSSGFLYIRSHNQWFSIFHVAIQCLFRYFVLQNPVNNSFIDLPTNFKILLHWSTTNLFIARFSAFHFVSHFNGTRRMTSSVHVIREEIDWIHIIHILCCSRCVQCTLFTITHCRGAIIPNVSIMGMEKRRWKWMERIGIENRDFLTFIESAHHFLRNKVHRQRIIFCWIA